MTFKAKTRKGAYVHVQGWALSCGLVLHRSLPYTPFGIKDDAWTVSDPVTGCFVANGASMSEAVLRTRGIQALYGDAFTRVMALKRVSVTAEGTRSGTVHCPPVHPHWSTLIPDWPTCFWEKMELAPRSSRLGLRGKAKDGTVIEDMHWASDLSGEDQPPFQGWFVPNTPGRGFVQVLPVSWQPMEARP